MGFNSAFKGLTVYEPPWCKNPEGLDRQLMVFLRYVLPTTLAQQTHLSDLM